MLMQNCSSFLIKRNKQTCSTLRNNLKALDPCYKWLIYHKTVGMEPAAQGKDIVTTINKKPRTTLSSIRHMICKNKYCPALRMAAIHGARAILRNQKPGVVRRKQTTPPTVPEHLYPQLQSNKGVKHLPKKAYIMLLNFKKHKINKQISALTRDFI
ncbi:unnamed protein product [Nyctereutes procyonoides]|uniref:(raccoon dog) hypothetical protein n=1 Tax=Nyctereutes procyonoides TaxID=34880 RepID=A0A811YMW4_NYCPR|nr:unnamed protein product [Nyctereutes procyonoides]